MPGEDENRRAMESALDNMTPEQRELERRMLAKVVEARPSLAELKALKEETFKARLVRAAETEDPHAVIRECVERIAEAAREIHAVMHGPRVGITIHTTDGGAMLIGYALKEHGDAMGRQMVYGVKGVAITLEADKR